MLSKIKYLMNATAEEKNSDLNDITQEISRRQQKKESVRRKMNMKPEKYWDKCKRTI